jgi:NodT family efflux transporter outer membrane factor (OMF) lipoprotein
MMDSWNLRQGRARTGAKGFLASVFSSIALTLLVAGCAVGPDYTRPEVPTPAEWMEAGAAGLKRETADYSRWWEVFADPVLDSLIEKTYQQNLDLQIAGVRIYEARAQLGIAMGSLYPQSQSAFGELSANRLSENMGSPITDRDFNALSLGFDAAWEVDIWGRFRRSVESTAANLEASIAGYDDILVSLTAETARVYIVIRTLQKRLEIARENVRIQERSLAIATARFEGGDVSELDVAQAKSLLRDTQASIPAFERSLRQAKNALAVLIGMLPAEVDGLLEGPQEIPTATDAVVVDIPADLLRRRPDIRLAELRLAAQSPQIGIAQSDLYPHFYLFGTIGWQASDARTLTGSGNSLGDIFDHKSFFYTAGPGFSWNILNYGRIRNRVRVEDARFEQLVVNYKNTVLRAWQEVEDALVGFLRSRQEERFLLESVDASKRSVDISLLQYREGIVDFQRVLDSQRFLTTQADRLAAVSGSVGTSLVGMYKAMGGGWQLREGKEFVAPVYKQEMIQRTDWGNLMDDRQVEPAAEESRSGGWRRPDW